MHDTLNGAPRSSLLHNLLLFGRLLHGLGLDVNPGRMIDVVQALGYIDIGRKSDFYHTLRTLCVRRKEHLALFEEAFAQFWRKPGDGAVDLNLNDLLRGHNPKGPIVQPPQESGDQESGDDDQDGEDEPDNTVIEVTQTYSAIELLRAKDFEAMTANEIAQVKKLMAQLIWQLGQRRTRRRTPGGSDRVDFRRTLRRSFRTGGELLHFDYQTPTIKPRPLVVLADISGSMERYTRLLIHFLYSLAEGLDQRVEVFVFGTRLTRVTRQLRNRDADRAIAEATAAVPDWGGGTRIGDAIKQFNYVWARRVLRGGAVTLLISDGWDRGDPDLLGKEMARLHKLTHRLIWLNPLLGMQRFEPLTRGLVAALPHVDDFLPVHNLSSLEELARHLALLDGKGGPLPHRALRGAAFVGGRRMRGF